MFEIPSIFSLKNIYCQNAILASIHVLLSKRRFENKNDYNANLKLLIIRARVVYRSDALCSGIVLKLDLKGKRFFGNTFDGFSEGYGQNII